MNNVQNDLGNNATGLLPPDKACINCLSPEVLQQIFSFLDDKSLTMAERVNRQWNSIIVDLTAIRENWPQLR